MSKGKWTLNRIFAFVLALMMILTVPEVSAAAVIDADVEDAVVESTEKEDEVEEEATEKEAVVESIKTEIQNIDNNAAANNGKKITSISGQIYEMEDIQTTGFSMSLFTNTTYPSLKEGNGYVDWIERINLPEYGYTFYGILAASCDGEADVADYLIEDEYFSNVEGTQNLMDVTYTNGERDYYNYVPAALIEGEHDSSEAVAVLAAAYQAFDRDYPDVFWLSGAYRIGAVTTYYNDGTEETVYTFITKDYESGFDIRLEDFNSEEKIYAAYGEMATVVEEIYGMIPEDATVVEEIRIFNDWLTKNNEYCTASVYPDTSYECVSAFLDAYHTGNKGPVCEAYARAFKILCDIGGIPCVLVDGDAGEAHMWNNVQVDGVWYAVDVTWNDPVGGNSGKLSGGENEAWLLVGSDTLYEYVDGSSETFAECHEVQNTVVDGGIAFINGPVLNETEYPLSIFASVDVKNESVVYGYETAPEVVVELVSTVNGTVTYQWCTKNGEEYSPIANAESKTMPIGLNVGTYYCLVYVDGICYGYLPATVTQKEIAPVISGSTTKTYDGTNTVGTGLTITLNGVLAADTDKVTVKADFIYADVNAGTNKTINATNITISGEKASNYKLTATTATANVGKIEAKDISDATVALDKDELTYNGKVQTVNPTVTVDGKTLVAGTDYTVSGNTAKDVKDSAYTVTITGKGNYTGTVTDTYTISFLVDDVIVKYNDSTTVADWYNNAVTITAEGYTISNTLDGAYSANYLVEDEGTNSGLKLYFKNADGYITDAKTISTIKIDKTAPIFTGENDGIKVSTNIWKEFLNTITFNIFHISTQDVTISATDNGSGVAKYYYYVDNSGATTTKTAEELENITFKELNGLSLDADGKYVIYAYAVDNAGNKSGYICTDGIVIDTTAPIVTKVEEPTVEKGTLKDTSATITFTANEAGSYYMLSGNATDTTIYTPEDIASHSRAYDMVAGQNTFTIDPLNPNTYNVVYIAVRDTAGNLSDVVIEVEFTTQKTLPTITTNPTITGTYGDAVKDMTLADGEASVPGTWAISTEATDVPEVGTTNKYVVIFTPADTNAYGSVSVEVVPTVAKKEVTVSINNVEKTYGTDNPELTYRVEGLVNGDTSDVLGITLSTDATKKSPVASYEITGTANAKNYEVYFNVGNLVIKKATATNPTAIEKEYVYSLGSEGNVYIPLNGLLPADNGGAIYKATKVDENDIIVLNGCGESEVGYSVKNTGKNGDAATITVIATSQNYEDITITIYIKLVDKLSVSPKGEVTTVGTLTYGDTLGKLAFGEVTFVDSQDNAVAGTITWDTPDEKLNAGTHEVAWTFTPSNTGKYKTATGTVSVTVAKATPNVAVPTTEGITYNPSKTLADIAIITGETSTAGTWAWKDASVVPTVGNEGYVAVFTPTDAANYNTVEKTVAVEVAKATPVVSVAPTAAAIVYGDTLADSALTGGTVDTTGAWTWKDATIAPTVADSNITEYEVVFTPADTTNYNTTTVKVKLVVDKAQWPANVPADEIAADYDWDTVGKVELPDGWEWVTTDVNTELEYEVEVTATANYVGDDKGNFENVVKVIKITRNVDAPHIEGDEETMGWEAIADEMADTEKDEVRVDMNGHSVVSGDALETLRDEDKTLVVIFVDENGKEEYTWTIKGEDVEDGDVKALDMNVELFDKDATDKPAIPETLVKDVVTGAKDHKFLSLSHDGEFGFKASLTINVGTANAGKLATLYYYNETSGKLEETENVKIEVAADGTIVLAFEHASDYVLTINEKVVTPPQGGENGGQGTTPGKPATGDDVFGNVYFYITLLLAGGLAGYVGVRKKREEQI